MNQPTINVSVDTLEGRITPRRVVGRVWAALLAGGSEGAEREAALILAEHAEQIVGVPPVRARPSTLGAVTVSTPGGESVTMPVRADGTVIGELPGVLMYDGALPPPPVADRFPPLRDRIPRRPADPAHDDIALMPPLDPDLLAELCEHRRRELEKPATFNTQLRFWFWGSLHWPCPECEREQHAAWAEGVAEQFRNAVGAISRGEAYEWTSGSRIPADPRAAHLAAAAYHRFEYVDPPAPLTVAQVEAMGAPAEAVDWTFEQWQRFACVRVSMEDFLATDEAVRGSDPLAALMPPMTREEAQALAERAFDAARAVGDDGRLSDGGE